MPMIASLDRLVSLARGVGQLWGRRAAPGEMDSLRQARDAAVQAARWSAALDAQEHLLSLVPSPDRAGEAEWLAVIHYERGREELAGGNPGGAAAQFRSALRSDRHFLPATVALGDALQAGGDHREAIRTWERAVESDPALPVLGRLERAYRDEGRPSRMIALYRGAAEHAPDDLALAVELGRVYFDLEMLDEAADQFEKIEVRAPDLPVVHAFLGAVFEHRGETGPAFAEYRRALRLGGAFTVTHRCRVCGATAEQWQDRCPQCRRWNTLRASANT
jgi:lipopolysaccharide biosynthesis regulator YciM